jgi:copper oxidase (laccase) domain-containing protein
MTNRSVSMPSATTAQLVPVHWPAPARVRSFCSTRIGGISAAPYDALNLSVASGDSPQHVAENVTRLCHAANLPHRPVWPRQVHGIDAVDRDATTVAAAHAGWRGLAAGVLESTIDAMPCRADQLLAWLGPAIGPQAYEVGGEVRSAFTSHDPQSDTAFVPSGNTAVSDARATPRWLADLYTLARRRLQTAGVTAIYGGDFCTLTDSARFFSYRRDGVTGRMASGIWLAAD